MTRKFSLCFLIAVLTTGCWGHKQNLANMTADQLFARGQSAFERHKWTEAIESFERFTVAFPTHGRAAEARFKIGESYFGKREFITAATEFNRLSSDFPAGPWADDARYKVCESYVRLSPKPQLDQQYTQAALDHCQSLETFYPTSEYVEKARAFVTDLSNKLAEKQFRTGDWYYKRSAIDPALIYFEAIVRDYPATRVAPRALLRMYEAYTKLEYKEEADAAKARLLKEYPESDEAKGLQAVPVAKSS
jgi:outer membrane protein assembly factor BamD